MPDSENVFLFVWKIENFSMLPHQIGEDLESPLFIVDGYKDVEFYLSLYPRGEGEEGELSLFLCKKPEDLDLKLNFTLVIESTEPSEEIIQLTKDQVLETGFGFPTFVRVKRIYDTTKHYLPQDTLTIRCEISPAEKISSHSDKEDSNSEETSTELIVNKNLKTTPMFLRKYCVSSTCIKVQKRSIMWSIRNVKERILRPEKVYILLASFLENLPSLKVTLDFNKIVNDDYFPISINQTCLPSQEERLFVKCKITVTSIHKTCHASKTDSHLFEKNTSDVWRFPPFLTTNMLEDKTYFNGEDTLLLRCEFFFSYKNGVRHFENNYTQCTFETRQRNSDLSTCFENIYSSGKFCDIELKAGGKTFPYYKLVLCARSSVFSAMFENNMKEKNSNVVEIEDVDPDTLQRMLTHMHSDVLREDLSSEDACKLYRVADKYDLSSLKIQSSALLATKVSTINVCDLLVLADAHLDDSLMTAVSDFICSHTAEVFNSRQWKSLMEDNSKLSSNVMHKMWIGMCQI